MIKGVDVSSYQPEAFPTKGHDFVFIKATEGVSYTNPKLTAQTTHARKAGLVVGFYHFVRDGSMKAQADYFLSKANPKTGDILALDWEDPNVSNAQKDEFIRYLMGKAPQHRVILYCNRDYWLNRDRTSYAGDGLWIADYVTAGKPRIKARWLIHQYTDRPLDQDLAQFPDRAAMRAWAEFKTTSGKPLTPTPTMPKPALPAPLPKPHNKVTTPYGKKGSMWRWKGYHTGDDYACPSGTPVYATRAGTVDRVSTDTSFGRYVRVDHGHGVTSWYCHLSSASVRVGQKVKAGALLGKSGATGNVSGPHLHYEERVNNEPRKPVFNKATAAAKPKVYLSRLRPGVTDSDSVRHLQRRLNGIKLKGGRNLPITGNFARLTFEEVKKWQVQKAHDPGDGLLGPKQAALLFGSGYTIINDL